MSTSEISSVGDSTPEQPATSTPRATWDSLGLSNEALELIRKAGFDYPTPVQAESIPVALSRRDLVASAQTGTGKTASFVLPMVERFAGRQGTFGLILAPTREIAQQTQATLEIFGTPRGVRSIVLIGGINMRQDETAIASYPQIIVATPGRLCDHLDRGNIWLDFIEMVVLDEADRMLDMGFAAQLSRIMEDVPEHRQTLLYSATIPPSVDALSRKILREPHRVAIGKPLSAAKTVEQKLLHVREEAKNRELIRLIHREPGSIIVFTRSKDGATRVWRSLHSAGVYEATYIHSDRTQAHREQALAEFKEGKYRILIATDVAGRGIHVNGVAHVVNYDLPLEPEDYVHRIGRTGRAEATGKATSFVTSKDRRLLSQIERLLGRPIDSENNDPPRERSQGDRPPRAQESGAQGRDEQQSRGGDSRSDGGDRDSRRRRRGRRGGRDSSERSGERSERSGDRPQTQAPQPQSAGRSPSKHPAKNPAPLRAVDFMYDESGSQQTEPPREAGGSNPAEGSSGPGKRRRRRRRGGRDGGGKNEQQ